MTFHRLLVFAPMVIGTKSSRLWSRIYEEYQSLSKKNKLIVLTEEVTVARSENFSFIKIPKFSRGTINMLLRLLVITYVVIKHRQKYDLVFIRVLGYPFMFAGIITKKLLKKKVVVWISNTETSYTGLKNKIYKLLYKKILVFADTVCISSKHIIDNIQKYIGTVDKSKFVIIKKGTNTSRFKPLNNQKNKNEILYVGRISRIKNIENIILALPLVAKKIPDVKLKIIGNIEQQSYFKSLKKLIKKLDCERNVVFLGPIEHEKLITYYNSANIFVLMSHNEVTSQASLEAMACELPIIVTPVGILPELIIDGKNGFFVKANHPQLLAEKIILVLQNKHLQEKIGKAARKAVKNLPDIDSFADQFNKLISEVSIKN